MKCRFECCWVSANRVNKNGVVKNSEPPFLRGRVAFLEFILGLQY